MELTSKIKSTHSSLVRNSFIENNVSLIFSLLIISTSLIIRFWCLGAHQLFVEEAYYWNYSQHLDFSYLDHPPMVAFLIKVSTLIFGTYEYGVRFPALLCWIFATFFSFKLTELINQGSGLYAVVLISVMPFYFIQSIIITPDQPVLACWSALLYYFYRIFILDESKAWYKAGIWLGLGMLSKYTIALLGPAALLYMIIVPSSRYWFARKEPYLCVVIALCLFTPVIYWNVMHEWASFIFQSTRRFKLAYKFSLHHFLGLILLFLLPGGVIGLCLLFNKKYIPLENKVRWFIQIFTLFPLLFFGFYSLKHSIKLDWIGPGLISIIPWLALLITKSNKFYKAWHLGSLFLLPCYVIFVALMGYGLSEKASQLMFRKQISWENLTQQFHNIAKTEELNRGSIPVIVPLDLYNIASEIAFYQAKLFEHGKIQERYPIVGRHIFGEKSLMYLYWSKDPKLSGKNLILITTNPKDFDLPSIKKQTLVLTPKKQLWSYSQGREMPVEPYYYEIVQMK